MRAEIEAGRTNHRGESSDVVILGSQVDVAGCHSPPCTTNKLHRLDWELDLTSGFLNPRTKLDSFVIGQCEDWYNGRDRESGYAEV